MTRKTPKKAPALDPVKNTARKAKAGKRNAERKPADAIARVLGKREAGA